MPDFAKIQKKKGKKRKKRKSCFIASSSVRGSIGRNEGFLAAECDRAKISVNGSFRVSSGFYFSEFYFSHQEIINFARAARGDARYADKRQRKKSESMHLDPVSFSSSFSFLCREYYLRTAVVLRFHSRRSGHSALPRIKCSFFRFCSTVPYKYTNCHV